MSRGTAEQRIPEERVAGEGRAAQGATPATKRERLLSLDVFRGITLVGMVVVNSPGSRDYIYPAVAHASWNHWAFADSILPFFVFIVGVAIPFSLGGLLKRGESRAAIVWRIVRRVILLFVIGLVMNGFPHYDLATLRIFNALQRIALCYLFASIIYLWMRLRGQAILGGVLLMLYFVLMKYVPVPGYGAGVLEPEGNWCQYIDYYVLRGRMQFPTWESKGLLSTVPAVVTALMGVWTGQYLRSAASPLEKTVNMYFFGAVSLFLGLVWSLCFPVNQALWTSSLVMLMGGIALVVLASCYYVCDIKRITWWTPPFLVFGMNSLAVWVLTIMFQQTLGIIKFTGADGTAVDVKTSIFRVMEGWLGPWNGSLLFALVYTLFWLGVLSVLYRKGIFIKV